jgi:hypothetical protein
MRFKLTLASFAAGFLAVTSITTVASAQTREHPRYTVTDLGVLRSGNNSSGFDMNDAGWVAGSSNLVPNG